jgi:hypothetical protein
MTLLTEIAAQLSQEGRPPLSWKRTFSEKFGGPLEASEGNQTEG